MTEISCNLGLLALLCVLHGACTVDVLSANSLALRALVLAANSGSTEPLEIIFLTDCGTAKRNIIVLAWSFYRYHTNRNANWRPMGSFQNYPIKHLELFTF